MPRPVDPHAEYHPGLDGLRTIAVALVIAFHLGFQRFSGGLLGVGVFFTLSGFLITRVLLGRWRRRGTAALGMFWVRRVRRLLPAMVLLLVVGMAMTLIATPRLLGTRAAQAVAALCYLANWHTIWAAQSYFARFAARGPFDHLWSLSVEEQFYVVWPILLLVLLALTRGRSRLVAVLTAALAMLSFGELALVAGPGFDNTRAYEGTDTRSGGLLMGAALALWLYHRPIENSPEQQSLGRVHRLLVDIGGVAGLGMIVLLAMTTTQYSMGLYRWGLLALTLSTCAVLLAICTPGSLMGRMLGVAPLRWLGERSYGLYLWHLPLIVFAPVGFLHAVPWLRDVVLVVLAIAVSAASWTWVEDPIRRRGIRASLRTPPGPDGDAARDLWRSVALLVLICLCAMLTTQVVAHGGASEDASQGGAGNGAAAPREKVVAPRTAHHSTSLCTSVVYIGDSTSEGLVSANYLPNTADRLPAQLRRVGVRTLDAEISGARSIIETWNGIPNAQSVARKHVSEGYHGCWIIALGTNDAANHYAGGPGYAQRIESMMSIIPASDPVMWVNVKTRVATGFYAAQHAVEWDNALVAAAASHHNMRIYDWASEVQDSWFIQDQIHFNSVGCRQRSRRIASALANAFPLERAAGQNNPSPATPAATPAGQLPSTPVVVSS